MASLWTARSLALWLVAVFVASCVPGLQPLTPELQTQRSVYDGYSLLPPQGSDWSVASVTPREQVYVRRPSSQPQYSAIFQASIKRMPRTFSSYEELKAFTEAAHQYQATQDTSGRFRNKTYTYAPDPAYPRCVRYRGVSDDHGAPNRGDQPFLRLVGVVLACPHLDRPGLIVIVDTSQRAPASIGTEAYDRMANAFLAGFKFEK